MRQLFQSRHPKTLLSYFLFAVAVICAVKIIWEYQALLGILRYFFSLITPFVFGFCLAYILNIPCSWLQKMLGKSGAGFLQRKKKPISILLTYALFLLLISLVVRLIVPAVSMSIGVFTKNLSVYYANAQRLFDTINSWNLLSFDLTTDFIVDSVKNYGMENISQSIAVSLDAISSVFSALFTFFLAFVSSIYILAEKENFKRFACRMLRAFLAATPCNLIIRYAGNLNRYFRQYIFCQTIDGCILGTLATIELYLIGSPYFLLLGIMLGIVNYIPYFGSIIGSLVAVAVVGFTQGLTTAVIAAAVLLITQQIDGNLIQPRLMGGSFSLSPLLIIISITIGGALGGPLGMIAAIPIVAVLKGMADDLVDYMESARKRAEPTPGGVLPDTGEPTGKAD